MFEQPRSEYPPVPPPAYFQQAVQVRKPADGFAIASLVLGILWIGWVGSAMALIFGHIHIHQARQANLRPSGLAVAGLVLGYIGVASATLVVLLAIASAAGSGS